MSRYFKNLPRSRVLGVIVSAWVLGVAGCSEEVPPGSHSPAQVSSTTSASPGFSDTTDYWKCVNAVGGEWRFGRAPQGCDVAAFTDPESVEATYQPVVFADTASSISTERSRYMQELHPVIRDTSLYYLKRKKPAAGASEEQAWVRAALAIAHQESYWSHYRKAADGRLKMIRGDFGHGHGMMQVDDRWHFPALDEGKGWNLIENLVYALDEYYAAWERAPGVWCVGSESDWKSRARAAYSAYNGGPSKICRWTDPNDPWSRNDMGFLYKWNDQSWNNYVMDAGRAASLDVGCLIDGGYECFANIDDGQLEGALIKVSTGEACVFKEGKYECIEDEYNAVCLAKIARYDPKRIVKRNVSEPGDYERSSHNSHDLCTGVVKGLERVSDVIVLNKANRMRATPGGTVLADVPAGSQLQVLDFKVTSAEHFNRHYRVTYNGQTGYIWGGNEADHNDWASDASGVPVNEAKIGTHGQWMRIHNIYGINLRSAPKDGAIITVVPKGATVLVKDTYTQGKENRIYYLVEYQGKDGFIYGGYLMGNDTTSRWAEVIPAPADSDAMAAYCPQGAWYDAQLKTCVDETHAYGPFPAALTERCRAVVDSGSRESCQEEWTVIVKDHQLNVQRWSLDFFTDIQAFDKHTNGYCPYGLVPSQSFSFHCVEAEGYVAVEVFGPFGSDLVEACLTVGGGNACYLNRWRPSTYNAAIQAGGA